MELFYYSGAGADPTAGRGGIFASILKYSKIYGVLILASSACFFF